MRNVDHCFRNAVAYLQLRETEAHRIVKSGIGCQLMFDMDDDTFQRHFRLTRQQYEDLNSRLTQMGPGVNTSIGGATRIPQDIKTLICLWYMANQNSFRELGDKFNIAQSAAHTIVIQGLSAICQIAPAFIKWPSECDKRNSARVFARWTGIDNVTGAIDGCHIRLQRPKNHGSDYINRKGYFSMLLQGICDDRGRFIDVFVGPPGRVHDARMLRLSPFYQNWRQKLGAFKLLGDSAYICNDFSFIVTPKRDNGRLSAADLHNNLLLSRGRVVIENAFGRLKCRFRRLRDLQNVSLDITVKLILAACTLHNLCMDESICDEHPGGCPREDDGDNM